MKLPLPPRAYDHDDQAQTRGLMERNDVENLKKAMRVSFTPTVIGATTAGTQTYSTRIGRWTRIGDLILFSFAVIMTAKDAATAGAIRITGLPKAALNLTGLHYQVGIFTSNVTQGATRPTIAGQVPAGQIYIQMLQSGSGVASQNLDASTVGATSELYGTGNYFV